MIQLFYFIILALQFCTGEYLAPKIRELIPLKIKSIDSIHAFNPLMDNVPKCVLGYFGTLCIKGLK